MGWCELPCKAHRCPWFSHPSDRHLVPHWAQRLCERCPNCVRCSAAHERAHSAQVSLQLPLDRRFLSLCDYRGLFLTRKYKVFPYIKVASNATGCFPYVNMCVGGLYNMNLAYTEVYLCAAGCVSQCPAPSPWCLPPTSCCCPSEWLMATRTLEDTLKPSLRKVWHINLAVLNSIHS